MPTTEGVGQDWTCENLPFKSASPCFVTNDVRVESGRFGYQDLLKSGVLLRVVSHLTAQQ
jgi:hypothetical protein